MMRTISRVATLASLIAMMDLRVLRLCGRKKSEDDQDDLRPRWLTYRLVKILPLS